MIDHIETKQFKLSYLANKLNQDIEINQSDILEAIILKDINSINNIYYSFRKLQRIVNELDEFILFSNMRIKGLDSTLNVIKKRLVGYKAVEASLIEAIKSSNEEDIQDALTGFNSITIKFSEDTKKLISLADENLKENILVLKETNNNSQKDILYSFLLAIILILFSVSKLSNLHNKAKKELLRAEAAEEEQRKLQLQLCKYNDDLEKEIAQKTQELHQKIYTNFLSGLPNRNQLLEDTHLYDFKQMALLNIDKFQIFNDVYGEEMGNIALGLSAKFLQEQMKNDENTLLYHIGGDEFVYVVKDSIHLYDTNFIVKIESLLKNYANKTFSHEDKKFNFIMSAGLAFNGKDKMLAYADMALKDAKKRNIQLSVFSEDKELERIHQEDIHCHKTLLTAFEKNRVISYFQPILPLQKQNKVTKYESLVRIQDDNGEIITPVKFIHIAKTNRIYHKLTDRVVENTLFTISKYKIPCSINISMDDIENAKTMEMIYEKFDRFEYNELLTIELLETEEFKDYKTVFDFCVKVRSYGIKTALDDFGSGYSNFSHILNLPVDYIKIDASLISNIDRDLNSRMMVETIVGVAKKLHIETIAEFVSSKEIFDVIKELKVDYAQGFYVGKPERIENYLEIT
ncbi:EAL domain-containing protein [bacterium]|nr:EAL domain-containing protein [bacterium]MBU1990476.1 EAL domain-containing protein [bacterium]